MFAAAAVSAAGVAASALPALAADAGALGGDAATAAGAIVSVAGLGGLLIATDPQRRRTTMAEGSGGDEMSSVKDYFEGTGTFHASHVAIQSTSAARSAYSSIL